MMSLEPLFKLAFLAGGTYLAYQVIEGKPATREPLSPPAEGPLRGPGPVKRPPTHLGPSHKPLSPLGPSHLQGPGPADRPPPPPLQPATKPSAGRCVGVTDKAYAPFTPNIKNPCPNQPWGWSLIPNPTANQCKTYVGDQYLAAQGGCIYSGNLVFLLINNVVV